MTDRPRRSPATGSLAAIFAATAWMAGPSLRNVSAWGRPLRVVVP
jgi:hypothetical protein